MGALGGPSAISGSSPGPGVRAEQPPSTHTGRPGSLLLSANPHSPEGHRVLLREQMQGDPALCHL